MYDFSRLVASRYLWTKRSEAFISVITWISVLGVAIGVMVITITMSIMSGFEYELKEKLFGAESHVIIRKSGGQLGAWEAQLEKISALSTVESAAAFTHSQALLRTEQSASGLLIRGIQPDSAYAKELTRYMPSGVSADLLFKPVMVEQDGGTAQLPPIIVGQELLRNMGIRVGDIVALLSPEVSPSPLGLMPRFKRFVIVGSYNSGLVHYESGLAYLALDVAQQFFSLGDKVSGIEVRVKDVDAAPQVAKSIHELLGGFPIFVQDWTQINAPLWDALKLEKQVYFIVLLLIVVMASFSIITTLTLLVMEKRGDIAILKTLGATRSAIGNIFRIQGSIIGGAGTVLGLLLGYLGCLGLREYGFPLDEKIFQISQVPVHMELSNFIAVGIVTFIICYIATLYPSYRASSVNPIDVLRYE